MTQKYQRCFIAAPFGLELGIIPDLLAERGIAWEWAKTKTSERPDSRKEIEAADFIIVVLNGTKADYRCVFEYGIAVGLSKPILLIQTKTRTLPLDMERVTYVKASLSNRDALAFHLDILLSYPSHMQSNSDFKFSEKKIQSRVEKILAKADQTFGSQLEKRVYDALLSAGGAVIAQPSSQSSNQYRPDFLAWLGNLDPDLLDPVVIEVKGQVDLKSAFMLDERLLKFMQLAHFRMAFVLTGGKPPIREQQLSPNILWFTIEDFERMIASGQLGGYVRATRNRIAHGVR